MAEETGVPPAGLGPSRVVSISIEAGEQTGEIVYTKENDLDILPEYTSEAGESKPTDNVKSPKLTVITSTNNNKNNNNSKSGAAGRRNSKTKKTIMMETMIDKQKLRWSIRTLISTIVFVCLFAVIHSVNYFENWNYSNVVTFSALGWNICMTIIITFEETLVQAINASQNNINDNKKVSKKDILKHVAFSTWKKRSLYGPLVAHLADVSSDLGLLVEYYQSYFDTLFFAGLSIFLFYHILSFILIYRFSLNWKDGLLQLFDLYIFKVLKVSYELGLHETSWMQDYIRLIEAVFESLPQALITTYLIVIEQGNVNNLIWFSFGWSIISIANCMIKEDESWFRIESDTIKLGCKISKKVSKWKCNSRRCLCCNGRNILRRVWRYIDTLSRLLILTQLWIMISGWFVIGLLCFEFIFFFFITNKVCGVCQGDIGNTFELYLINGMLGIYPNGNDLRGFSGHGVATCFYSWNRHLFNIIICIISISFLYDEDDEAKPFEYGFIWVMFACVILNLFFYWLITARQCMVQGDYTNPGRPWMSDPKCGWNWTKYEASTTRNLLGCTTVAQIKELRQFGLKTISEEDVINDTFWMRVLEPLEILEFIENVTKNSDESSTIDCKQLRSGRRQTYHVVHWIGSNQFFTQHLRYELGKSEDEILEYCQNLVKKFKELEYELDFHHDFDGGWRKYDILELSAWYQPDTHFCRALLETKEFKQFQIHDSVEKLLLNTVITSEEREKMKQLWIEFGIEKSTIDEYHSKIDQWYRNKTHKWLFYIPTMAPTFRPCCQQWCPCLG